MAKVWLRCFGAVVGAVLLVGSDAIEVGGTYPGNATLAETVGPLWQPIKVRQRSAHILSFLLPYLLEGLAVSTGGCCMCM
jgi:hypothetical protein